MTGLIVAVAGVTVAVTVGVVVTYAGLEAITRAA